MNRPSPGLIYLASPYSSRYGHLRAERYKAARRALHHLVEHGEVVFAPVVYGHPLDEAVPGTRDADYWMRLCLPIMIACARVYVLTIDGWNTSNGLRREVALASEFGKPIHGFNPWDEEEFTAHDIRRLCAMSGDGLADPAAP